MTTLLSAEQAMAKIVVCLALVLIALAGTANAAPTRENDLSNVGKHEFSSARQYVRRNFVRRLYYYRSWGWYEYYYPVWEYRYPRR